MKRESAFFVVLAVLFVSLVLSQVIPAEQAVAGKGDGINNATNPFEYAHMPPKEFSPDRNKPAHHEIDPLYQGMEEREKDLEDLFPQSP